MIAAAVVAKEQRTTSSCSLTLSHSPMPTRAVFNFTSYSSKLLDVRAQNRSKRSLSAVRVMRLRTCAEAELGLTRKDTSHLPVAT